jgi:hypothetical protein
MPSSLLEHFFWFKTSVLKGQFTAFTVWEVREKRFFISSISTNHSCDLLMLLYLTPGYKGLATSKLITYFAVT